MSKKIKTIEIVAKDFYGDECFLDRIGAVDQRIEKTPPTGYVEIHEEDENGKKQLVGRHNLVLYQGREWVAQRLVNRNNSNVTSLQGDYINWFGLGTGGVIPGDPFNPSPPTLTDTELSTLTAIAPVTDSSAADYHVIDSTSSTGYIYPVTGNYKIPFDSIEFEQDALNDDSWLVMKITTTVGVSYANGVQLSEAGLYVSSSETGGHTGPFALFSRVTFPSLVKTSDRRLIFSWFLYV